MDGTDTRLYPPVMWQDCLLCLIVAIKGSTSILRPLLSFGLESLKCIRSAQNDQTLLKRFTCQPQQYLRSASCVCV